MARKPDPKKPPAPDAPATPPGPTDMEDVARAQAAAIARNDALAQLRNATAIANAGFASALEKALNDNTEAALTATLISNAILAASSEFWNAIDRGKPYDGGKLDLLYKELLKR